MKFSSVICICVCTLFPCDCNPIVPAQNQGQKVVACILEELGIEHNRTHDFGKVIISPDLKLSYHFPIKNGSNIPVKLLRSINQKPCCGVVEFEPTTLKPGESCNLTVILKVGESTSPLSHLAIVETDHPKIKTLEFFTFATPQPRIVLDRMSDSTFSLKSGESKKETFVIHSYGDKKNKPIDLNSVTLKTDLEHKWVGQLNEIKDKLGFIECTRQFDVICKGDGQPGSKSAAIQLKNGDQILYNGNLQWEVTPLLKVSPSVLFVTFQNKIIEKSITLSSINNKAFQISETISDIPDVKLIEIKQIDATHHSLVVQIKPERNRKSRTGVIEIKTTHPEQPKVRLSLFFTNPPVGEKTKGSE